MSGRKEYVHEVFSICHVVYLVECISRNATRVDREYCLAKISVRRLLQHCNMYGFVAPALVMPPPPPCEWVYLSSCGAWLSTIELAQEGYMKRAAADLGLTAKAPPPRPPSPLLYGAHSAPQYEPQCEPPPPLEAGMPEAELLHEPPLSLQVEMQEVEALSAHIKECFLLETQIRVLEQEMNSRAAGVYVHYEDWTLLDALRTSVSHNEALLHRRLSLLPADAQEALAAYAQQLATEENQGTEVRSA